MGEELFGYLHEREKQLLSALDDLRTLDEIRIDLARKGVPFAEKKLKSGWFRSPLMAEVEDCVRSICESRGITYESNPPVGHPPEIVIDQNIHILPRQLDLLIPSLRNPKVVIEVKEYWGEKRGGSKMSNAVYETYCVARELMDLYERYGVKVYHYVVMDGKQQWSYRRGDLRDFLDMLNQGLLDGLFFGRSACSELKGELGTVLH